MSTYLIDYENTNTSGLKGISKLSKDDRVVIFFGQNAGAISFNLHIEIAQTLATVDYIKINKTGKNYLDFQLATYLGYLIASTKELYYMIISKDTGYDSLIDFWKQKKSHLHITKQSSIEDSFKGPSTIKVCAQKQNTLEHTTKEAPKIVEGSSPKTTQTIEEVKLAEKYKTQIRLKMKDEQLKGGSYNSIYHLFLKARDKQSFHTGLVKAFGQERGSHFYKVLLSEFESILAPK